MWRAKLLWCAVGFFAAHPVAGEWPMYLGNLSHSSYKADEIGLNASNVSRLQQIWRTSVGSTIASGITVSRGALYFGAWDGNFYSMNAVDGAIRWRQFVGKSPDARVCPGSASARSRSSRATPCTSPAETPRCTRSTGRLEKSSGASYWRTPMPARTYGPPSCYGKDALYVGIASLADCPLVRSGVARIALDDPTNPRFRYLVPEDDMGAGVWTTPAIGSALRSWLTNSRVSFSLCVPKVSSGDVPVQGGFPGGLGRFGIRSRRQRQNRSDRPWRRLWRRARLSFRRVRLARPIRTKRRGPGFGERALSPSRLLFCNRRGLLDRRPMMAGFMGEVARDPLAIHWHRH